MNLLLFVVNLLSFVMLFAKSDVPTFAEFDYYQVRKRPTLLRLLRTFSFVREASDLDPGTWTWSCASCERARVRVGRVWPRFGRGSKLETLL